MCCLHALSFLGGMTWDDISLLPSLTTSVWTLAASLAVRLVCPMSDMANSNLGFKGASEASGEGINLTPQHQRERDSRQLDMSCWWGPRHGMQKTTDQHQRRGQRNKATDNVAAVCGNGNGSSTSVVGSYLELAIVPQENKKYLKLDRTAKGVYW